MKDATVFKKCEDCRHAEWPHIDQWVKEDWIILHKALNEAKKQMLERRK